MNALAFLPPAGIRPAPIKTLAFEAFNFNERDTSLRAPLDAATLKDAIAEVLTNGCYDRGDRLGIREIGDDVFGGAVVGKIDRLHVYAVRQKSHGRHVHDGFTTRVEHDRWLEPICTIDLNVIAGIGVALTGYETEQHERRQCQRPEGARMVRR